MTPNHRPNLEVPARRPANFNSLAHAKAIPDRILLPVQITFIVIPGSGGILLPRCISEPPVRSTGQAADPDGGLPPQPRQVRSPTPTASNADPGLDQPARSPTPNELNTRVPLDLTDTGVVDHQDGTRIAEVIDHVPTHVVGRVAAPVVPRGVGRRSGRPHLRQHARGLRAPALVVLPGRGCLRRSRNRWRTVPDWLLGWRSFPEVGAKQEPVGSARHRAPLRARFSAGHRTTAGRTPAGQSRSPVSRQRDGARRAGGTISDEWDPPARWCG